MPYQPLLAVSYRDSSFPGEATHHVMVPSTGRLDAVSDTNNSTHKTTPGIVTTAVPIFTEEETEAKYLIVS